jgi:hypothetical protein
MVELSSNLLKEIKNTENIKHIVRSSVMGADAAKPETIGGRVHRQAEKMMENSGISYTLLRPTSYKTLLISFLKQLRNMVHFTYLLEMAKSVLLMFVILQQWQHKLLPTIMMADIVEKHITLLVQKRFLIKMQQNSVRASR